MWILAALFKQKRFSFDNLKHFWAKIILFLWKSVEDVSPQIKISESTKSGQGKVIFSPFTQKQLEIHDATKNRLNALSH